MRHVKRAAVVAAVIWAYIVGYVSGTPAKPYCPTEDSCRASYSNGQWIITETKE